TSNHPPTTQSTPHSLHDALPICIAASKLRLHARDLPEPSPLAHEVLNSAPWAYLDDAPLEERRSRAVSLRRTLPEKDGDLGALRSEEHTSELQSLAYLVCRLLLD